MIDNKLSEYISEMKLAGVNDEQVRTNLIQGGWTKNDVDEAMGAKGRNSGMAIPIPPVPRFGMWISFEYVLLFITLWIWTGALGGVWNYAINKHIVDPLSADSGAFSYMNVYTGMFLQGYLAAIIVSYPVFAILFVSLSKQIEDHPETRNIRMRKILMYITLVVNVLYLLSTTITTTFGFLNATTSVTTIPRLLVNIIISGSICAVLLYELREDRKH